MTESEKNTAGEREIEDQEFCEEMFSNALNVPEVQIEKIFRLGYKVNGKERPLVAGFKDAEIKWNVLKKNKMLKDSTNIRIRDDQTKKEREYYAK